MTGNNSKQDTRNIDFDMIHLVPVCKCVQQTMSPNSTERYIAYPTNKSSLTVLFEWAMLT